MQHQSVCCLQRLTRGHNTYTNCVCLMQDYVYMVVYASCACMRLLFAQKTHRKSDKLLTNIETERQRQDNRSVGSRWVWIMQRITFSSRRRRCRRILCVHNRLLLLSRHVMQHYFFCLLRDMKTFFRAIFSAASKQMRTFKLARGECVCYECVWLMRFVLQSCLVDTKWKTFVHSGEKGMINFIYMIKFDGYWGSMMAETCDMNEF